VITRLVLIAGTVIVVAWLTLGPSIGRAVRARRARECRP
jgi:hypothetical protein